MGVKKDFESGFTVVELSVAMVVFAIVAISVYGLFISLVRGTILAKRQAVATTLATNQMEYLKSLPYDSLAISGGSIVAANPLPSTVTKTLNGVQYTIKSSINYVDDAYDGCANYGSVAQAQIYCRNYPAPTGSPNPDTNPQDYKIAHVTVTDKAGTKYAQVDTQISSRVSETASTTGALFITVIDSNGNKVSGATVSVANTTLSPVVNVSDTTDSNGTAIFYGLPPDSGTDYIVTAAKTGYSTLTTASISGTLQPTYPSQKILTQQSSFATLVIKPMGANSLIVETTDAAGTALGNVKVNLKGGYKKYTLTTDTTYYYDALSPTDTRQTTNASGLATLQNLVPGPYIFCGDNGATSCTVGATTYYLAAAVPYGGTNPFNPVTIPTYDASLPPAQTFDYSGTAYLQKVRLMLTTSSAFPRIKALTPSSVSKASGTISAFPFTVNGVNLPCSATASACGTTVRFLQDSNTFTASCTGTNGTDLSCTVNLSAAVSGNTQMQVVANGNTLTMPASPLIGGVVVTD